MNIKQAKLEIMNTVKAYLSKDETGAYEISSIHQRPLLLMGPPGIGKTQIMEQIARESNICLVAYTITHHTRQSAVGLPFIKEEVYDQKTYSITQYTMSEIIASIYQKMQATGLSEGILFIDEINCVSETLAPTMLQFLQCKTFGNQAVPKGWIIIAAGNPPEYNKSVRDFDMVTLDRVRYLDIEADFSIWKEYAQNAQIHRAILSYLELRPKNFYRIEEDIDGLRFVTARGWEDLSTLMKAYEKLNIPIQEETIQEFLHHPEVAQDVASYLDLFYKYQDDYRIPEILTGRIRSQVFARIELAAFDERLSVVSLLSDGLASYFNHVAIQKERTDLWYVFLKDFRSQLSDEVDPVTCYSHLLTVFEDTYNQKQKSSLYSKDHLQNCKWLLSQLKKYEPKESLNIQDAFAEAKEGFAIQLELLEHAEQKAADALEHAFDFMEQAFTTGQEMVIFVTNLTISKAACAFLSEHPCIRYTKYNEQLLIGTRREQLLSELARDKEQFS